MDITIDYRDGKTEVLEDVAAIDRAQPHAIFITYTSRYTGQHKEFVVPWSLINRVTITLDE